ncbi:MAG: hypothetical protein ACRCTZ_16165 [Sarcina sp.]
MQEFLSTCYITGATISVWMVIYLIFLVLKRLSKKINKKALEIAGDIGFIFTMLVVILLIGLCIFSFGYFVYSILF